MRCAVDNNHGLSMVFSKFCESCPNKGKGYDYMLSKHFFSQPANQTMVTGDGFVVKGIYAMDFFCYSMDGNKKQREDPNTKVCFPNQLFFHVNHQDDWDWGARATNMNAIDGICGLGKEKASESSQGLIARAVNRGKLRSNSYSIRLVP